MKRALVFGISGQDGSYLSRLLLSKGYEVHGTTRDAGQQTFANLQRIGVRDLVRLHAVSLSDFQHLLRLIDEVAPHEIYNLAGQSSVALSFTQPMDALESITVGTLQILEVLRHLNAPIRFYHASSSEAFGNIPQGTSADEETPFRPLSPYGVAKAAAHATTANYRTAYGLYACSGILFNHESPLRPARFVTRKIVSTACDIAAGKASVLDLGDLSVERDWGYAPEYVEAMWLMLQQEKAEDFVIATGVSHTLEDLVATAFRQLGMNWRDYVTTTQTLFRPTEIRYNRGNPEKAARILGWRARVGFEEMVGHLISNVV